MKKMMIGLLIVSLAAISIGIGYWMKQDGNVDGDTLTTVLQVDYPEYGTAEELVDASDLVFAGMVTDVEYQMINIGTEEEGDEDTGYTDDEAMPYTLYTVAVEKVYKGNVASSTITLKRPGGNFGHDTYIVEDASEILEGNAYLFAAESYGGTYPSLLTPSQGSYALNAPPSITTGKSPTITLPDILKLFQKK